MAPFDQNAMTFTGPTASVGGPQCRLGTARAFRPGAQASHPYRNDGTQVIGSICPTCGIITFLVDGHGWERVDTRSSSRHDRRVLISAFVGEQHTVTLEVSRGNVILDGYTDGYRALRLRTHTERPAQGDRRRPPTGSEAFRRTEESS